MPTTDHRPGIFWTWQDRQVEDLDHLEHAIADMAAHGFGALLVQPRGCRYAVDDDAFVAAVGYASRRARELGIALWVHLDPRSMAGPLVRASGESAEYLILAGTGDAVAARPRTERPLDVETSARSDGGFAIRLAYPARRPYHAHSDGAVSFRPLRLERCLAFRRDDAGTVVTATIEDVTPSARLFTNALDGSVEVFGSIGPRAAGDWRVLALVAFASNYPDYAGAATRARLGDVLDGYAESGIRLDGVWWDEPGYCTGFDRSFPADRGRLPWGPGLARIHRERTGREPLDDVLHLVAETDDGLWGSRREAYYRTIEAAVFGAQSDLRRRARAAFGDDVRIGVHQTWHQNADDVVNGCMDWWRGAAVLGGGFSDAGDADCVDGSREMAEVTAMAAIAVSLGRHSERGEASFNVWGVRYGEPGDHPGPDVVDWWVDLQATIGCSWLAHTYGPTGYFGRPSAWGPGYPDHPTWPRMRQATGRLERALRLAGGALPRADVALAYPLGTFFRMASDLANPLAEGAHDLVAALLRAGFEIDVVSPELLRSLRADRYRAVLYLHPFGASSADVEDLAARRAAGATIVAAGLPPVAGAGYASAGDWLEHLGLPLIDAAWPGSIEATAPAVPLVAGEPVAYAGRPHWGRPAWPATGSERETAVRAAPAGARAGAASYVALLLEGLGDAAPGRLEALGVRPGWRLPAGAIASRTDLVDGGTLVRLCPAAYGRAVDGTLRADVCEIEVRNARGLVCVHLSCDGRVVETIVPDGAGVSVITP